IISPRRKPASAPRSTKASTSGPDFVAPLTSSSRSSKSKNSISGCCALSFANRGAVSMTPHSAAQVSTRERTPSVSLTVFASSFCMAALSRCSACLSISSSRSLPSAGRMWSVSRDLVARGRARLEPVRLDVIRDEPLLEVLQRRHLLLLRHAVDGEEPLALLAPALRAGPGLHGGLHPLAVARTVRQPYADIHLEKPPSGNCHRVRSVSEAAHGHASHRCRHAWS